MFCPKCGDELISTPKGLYCQKGDMYLSQYMEKRLNNCFVLKTEEPRDFKFPYKTGDNWFCPGCGTKVSKDNGYLRCQNCHRSLDEFIHPLIE